MKVMTPLLGTKTQSAPVGDAPRGDTRAVRATAAKVFHESRNTRHESRLFRFFPKHETRNTNHGLCGRCVRRGCARDAQPETPARTAAHAAWSLLSCALWRGMGRIWRGMGGILPPEPLSAHCPRRQHGLLGFHESRNMFFPCPPATPRRATPSPANGFFAKRESRDTNHGFVESLPLGTEGLQSFFCPGAGLG